ncbi:type I restriction-modification enzyme R subunit C-terminal domain-containing protein [Vibrio maritimus]|uniref:type I restriction-modification enzyme R subunit C-terminal domain-containing protein n=1 Tax=Vibrio maritimus TaxID=990268 RepID=UPI001F26FBA6|nr:type I restriction-modification enzyme R subunit C-terminal domain-containing protein [Vibrio maritimus]
MLGRGTRLKPKLFGPNSPVDDKTEFKVFDVCQNFEYFEMNPDGSKDSAARSLSQVIFENRLQLAENLKSDEAQGDYGAELREYLLTLLHNRVAGMNLDNFIVRPNRQVVETYQSADIWRTLDTERHGELLNTVSSLPTEAEPIDVLEQDEELALRFDQLLLTMQLALVERTGITDTQQDKLLRIAEQLQVKASVPAVGEHLEWIEYVLSANFWEGVTLEDLETTRKRLRLLLQFIKTDEEVGVVYTNFDDTATYNEGNELHHFGYSDDLKLYRKRVEAYVREHENDLTIQRIKRGQPITKLDLERLDEQLFEASGIQDMTAYQDTIHPDKPVGLFIRELVGLDRNAAKAAFSTYLDDTKFNSDQIQFVTTIIDWLTENGTMNPAQLAKAPFTDIHFEGVFGLFDQSAVMRLRDTIKEIERVAFGE